MLEGKGLKLGTRLFWRNLTRTDAITSHLDVITLGLRCAEVDSGLRRGSPGSLALRRSVRHMSVIMPTTNLPRALAFGPLLVHHAAVGFSARSGATRTRERSPPRSIDDPINSSPYTTLNASGRNGSNSLFDQGFKLPWDDGSNDKNAALSNQWTLWPAPTGETPDQSQTQKRKPRTPRYPSALQSDTAVSEERSVDDYVRSAEDAINSSDGTDRGSISVGQTNQPKRQRELQPRQSKLGIVLIDHGSKRQKSNDFLQSVANSYQSTFEGRDATSEVVVRGAHMEIAAPSILTRLRELVEEDQVTKIICVPYFLSPGKHATIDVPNLIDEAKETLENEGLLDYHQGRVEILSSKSLGSNVGSMLQVVDSLVTKTLGDDGILDSVSAKSVSSTESEAAAELKRYINRATLLETMLKTKSKQAKTMKNRATLLEDALGKMKNKLEQIKDQSRIESEEKDIQFARKIDELTDELESVREAKAALEDQAKVLTNERDEAKKDIDGVVADLTEKVSSLQREVDQLRDEKDSLQLSLKEEEDQADELIKIDVQAKQDEIDKLKAQLTDLLDAYHELEQVQGETEDTASSLREKLAKVSDDYKYKLDLEREKVNLAEKDIKEVQSQLKEEIECLSDTLNESRSEHDAALEAERSRADEWEAKFLALSDEVADLNSTYNNSTDADIVANKSPSSDASDVELCKLKEQLESERCQHKAELEQQQQLQKYLQAQMQTYYEAIQNQTELVATHDQEIQEINTKHEESMMIATNSVNASRRREEELLTSVEELESELSEVSLERDRKSQSIAELQSRIDGLEDALKDARSATTETFEGKNEDLQSQVDALQHDLSKITREKEKLWLEKTKVEIDLKEIKLDHKARDIEQKEQNADQRKRRWATYILRPWLLFRRRDTES